MGVRAAAALLLLLLGGAGRAEVPIETPGRVESLPDPTPHWVLVADLLLQRNALLDLDSGTFLGLISTGYNSITAVGPRQPGLLYVPETFYSRGSRGERTDVVTIYDTRELAPVGEVEIPAKRALNVLPTANAALTDDDRFLLVFNLNPGTSVSVVDTRERRFAGEIPLPGCSLVYAAGDRRFFSLCQDGTLLLVTLDDAGRVRDSVRSERWFDPESDPVTEKAVRAGDRWIFTSFEGMVHTVDVSGPEFVFEETWSLLSEADREQSWRVGGSQHLAVHEASGRLFSLVHRGGPDTHKQPGSELWVYDLAARERTGKIELVHPGIELLGQSMEFGRDWIWPLSGLYDFLLGLAPIEITHVMVTRDDAPLLVTGSQIGGSLAVYDALSGEFLRRVSGGNLTVQRLDAPFDGGGLSVNGLALDPALHWVLRLALGALFASAAWHKLREPARFRTALRGYDLLPERAVDGVAKVLPALELLAAAALVLPGRSLGAALFAAGLLLLYTAAVAAGLLRGRRDIDCGCGGPAARRAIGADLVWRNLVLLAVAAACGPTPAPRALVPLDAVTVVAGAVTLALLYAATEAALANETALPRRNVARSRA